MLRITSQFLLLALFVVILAAPLSAQVPTGTITGTITDPSGAVIPNAKVTVTNKNTGASRVVQTNAEGIFSAPSLAAGSYEIRIEASGFQSTMSLSEIATGVTTTVNRTLQVGQAKK